MQINLTVIIKSKPEDTEILKSLLLDLVQNSKKETACLQYDLHQSKEESNTFIFHEIWENQNGLDNHNQQPYILSFFKNSTLLLQDPPILYKTTKLA